MAGIPLRREEGVTWRLECTEVENFFRREEISRAPGGAVESGRSDSPRRGGMLSPGFPFLPPVSSGPPLRGGAFGNRAWRRQGLRAKILMG